MPPYGRLHPLTRPSTANSVPAYPPRRPTDTDFCALPIR